MDLKNILERNRQQMLNQIAADQWFENKYPKQGYFDWDAKNVNDNIRKATTRAGAMFAKPAGLGEQAAGYMKTVAPKVAPKALGFFANPWLATLAGIFGASGMDQDRSAEFLGSPRHQQWLARKGPLSKDWQ